jgi:hypothetical protein
VKVLQTFGLQYLKLMPATTLIALHILFPACKASSRRMECHRAICCAVPQGWTLPDVDTLPTGMALPLLETFQRCRSQPPSGWPPEAYILIGRDDLAANAAMLGAPPPEAETVPTVVGSPIPAWAKSPSKRKPHDLPTHTPLSTISAGAAAEHFSSSHPH